MPRILLHTGSGASAAVAAATARRCAAAGRRTLLVSAGSSHDVGELLGTEPGTEPREVAPELWCLRVEARAELERRWGGAPAWLAAGPLPPGAAEVAAGLVLAEHATGPWEVVVADCGAPSDALRLLGAPGAARGWLGRGAPGRLLDALGSGLAGLAAPEVLAAAGRAARGLATLDDVLRDPESTSLRLVLAPGPLARATARRTLAELEFCGVVVDAVVVEEPDAAAGLRQALGATPVLVAPPLAAVGPAGLDELGAALWKRADPAALGPGARADEELTMDGDGAQLRLELPHADRGDLRLHRVGGSLVVGLAGQRRTLVLPPAVADYRPAGARFRDGALVVDLLTS